MSEVSGWIMSVVGICVLGVLVDLVLPSGQTKSPLPTAADGRATRNLFFTFL